MRPFKSDTHTTPLPSLRNTVLRLSRYNNAGGEAPAHCPRPRDSENRKTRKWEFYVSRITSPSSVLRRVRKIDAGRRFRREWGGQGIFPTGQTNVLILTFQVFLNLWCLVYMVNEKLYTPCAENMISVAFLCPLKILKILSK